MNKTINRADSENDTITASIQGALSVLILMVLWYILSIIWHIKTQRGINQWKKFQLPMVVLVSALAFLCSAVAYNVSLYIPAITLNNYNSLNFSYQQQCSTSCAISRRTWYFSFTVSEILVYIYLWLRLKLYYYKSYTPATRSTCYIKLIWICLAHIIATGLVLIVQCFSMQYECIDLSCSIKITKSFAETLTVLTSCAVLTMHLFILGLTVSLLLKQWREWQNGPGHVPSISKHIRKSCTEKVIKLSKKRKRNPRKGCTEKVIKLSKNRIWKALKRLVITTAICVVSDIVCFTVSALLKDRTRIFFVELTLMFNLLIVLSTFPRRWKTLFPFKGKVLR